MDYQTIAPLEDEFDLIQSLWKTSKDRAALDTHVKMQDTKVFQHQLMHVDSTNSNGRIHSGNLINRSIQVAYLSVLEMCEQSLKGTGAEKGAAELSNSISQVSIEHINFAHPIFVGDVLSLKAKVVFVEPKKGLVYVQVMMRAIDLATGKFTMHGETDSFGNQLYTIFKVSPNIPLKKVLPGTYTESLFYLKAKRVIDQF